MNHKMIGDHRLFKRTQAKKETPQPSPLARIGGFGQFSVFDASKGFLISLRASNRYKPRYIESLEEALGFLTVYADQCSWPEVSELTTAHLEDYLAQLSTRRKWLGLRGDHGLVSQSYVATQYRRIKRFFGWLEVRGHIEQNPLDLIPNPKVDEKVIETVSDREIVALLKSVDPKLCTCPSDRFRAIRDKAMLILLVDTPGRRSEFTELSIDDVDIDDSRILVMGKGGKERWMHLGHSALEGLWEYLQARSDVTKRNRDLWVDFQGRPMKFSWLRMMLLRRGKRVGIPGLHPHQFRHTFAVNALRSGMAQRLLEIEGGWRKIPETYLRTLGEEDAAAAHRLISPADRMFREQSSKKRRKI